MSVALDVLPFLLEGALITLRLVLMSLVVALAVAFVAGFARLARLAAVRAVSTLFVEVFRGTSLIVQLFWIFYVLPFAGIMLSPLAAGVTALGLNGGAFASEVVRGAILAVPKGQTEAAIALNMSPSVMMRRVILPQALPRMLAPFGNNVVEMVKATAITSLITVTDMTFRAMALRRSMIQHSEELLALLLVMYFVMSYTLTLGVRWLERRQRVLT